MDKIKFYPTRGFSDNDKKIWRLLGLGSPIVPATDFIPSWWKNLSKDYKRFGKPNARTAKTCPGIFDSVRAGYIVPMWSDIIFKWSEQKKDGFEYQLSHAMQELSECVYAHDSMQIKDAPLLENSCPKLIKLTTPWFVDVPKGVSLFLTAPFYHVNNDITIIPGIIDPDIDLISNKEINIFIKLNKHGEIRIDKGQPLLQIIPFKRSDYEFAIEMPDYEKELEYELMVMNDRTFIEGERKTPKHLTKNRVEKKYA